jgi:hypothetical protein
VAHSEETDGVYQGQLHGLQLWVAQPDATRNGPPAFEHHHELPRAELVGGEATVLIGALGGVVSPARRGSDHMGAELRLAQRRCVVPVEPFSEHAVVALDGPLIVAGKQLKPGSLAYIGVGHHDLVIESPAPTRALLVGGTPFPEPLVTVSVAVGKSAFLAMRSPRWWPFEVRTFR